MKKQFLHQSFKTYQREDVSDVVEDFDQNVKVTNYPCFTHLKDYN